MGGPMEEITIIKLLKRKMKLTRMYRKNKDMYVLKIVFWTVLLAVLLTLGLMYLPIAGDLMDPYVSSYNVKAETPRKLITPLNFMEEAAYIFGVNKYLMYCIVTHESGWNAEAKNPKSTAYGYGQFINSTWVAWRVKMGEDSDLSLRSNPQDAFWTMAWALDKGYRSHWAVDGRYCASYKLRP